MQKKLEIKIHLILEKMGKIIQFNSYSKQLFLNYGDNKF